MKKCLLWRKLSINKKTEFMYVHPRKPTSVIQGSQLTGTKDRTRSLSCLSDGLVRVVSYEIVIHFCEKKVKTVARNYQRDILTSVEKPLKKTIFPNRSWIFQQDSAPVYKAKTAQEWLKNHVPEFISSDHWPSASPDLNPLDYRLWSVLQGLVCTRRHHNLDSLKQELIEAVDNFLREVVCTEIDEWLNILRRCIQANGGHFEYFFL
ncbi:hypothetical protein QYM36_019973 [Artemia franciscana]|uniref:Tc1-like transposase DDE domain-containing protein n=1 Tax=Artemia franciscana TaxID=6661 RepID=A0AA88KYX1_ARTSF|nr:hypothetical protein QYM36_019973 [Artemia franciscana]